MRISILLLFLSTILYAQKPELRIQLGHSDQVNQVLFDPEGAFAVSCSNDKTIKVWDIKSGKELRSFNGHSQAVKSMDLSRNAEKLASGGNRKEKKVFVWDVNTGEKLHEISGFIGEISAIAFNKTADKIAVIENTGTFETRVSVWDIVNARMDFELKKNQYLFAKSVDFDPTGNDIVIGGEFTKKKGVKNIEIYDGRTGDKKMILKGTANSVAKVEYSYDGTHILAVGHTTQVWNTRDWTIKKAFDKGGLSGAYSPSGKYVMIGQNKKVYIWDLVNEKAVHDFTAHDKAVSTLQLSPDEKYFLTGSKSGEIKFWDMQSGQSIPHFEGRKADFIQDLTIKDGKLYSVVNDEKVQYWDFSSAKLKFLNTQPETKKRGFEISSFALNNRRTEAVITNTKDRGVTIWDVKSNTKKTFLKHSAYCKTAQFNSTGTIVAAGTMDNKIVVWNKSNPTVAYKLTGHLGNVNSIAFTQDSKYLVSGSQDKTIKVWDLSVKSVLHTITVGQYVNSVSISPDGTKILAACGNKQDVFRTGTSDLLVLDWNLLGEYKGKKKGVNPLKLEGHTKAVNYATFSSKGTLVASASVDNRVIVWKTDTGEKIKELEGHYSSVNNVKFSDDDKYIISGGDDGLIKIWDVLSGKCLVSVITFDNGKDYVMFTDDNYYTCTKAGTRNVHFMVDNQVYLFEQFDLRLNRPDLVVSQLPYTNSKLVQAYKKAYKKRLKKMGFTEQMLGNDYHVPEVKITNAEALPYSTKERMVVLNIEATDAKYNLDRINVWINDVPIYGSKGINLRGENTKSISKNIKLELSSGKNKIQVSVLNQKGAESFKADKFMYLDVPYSKPDLYVISIGVSQFNDAQFNLDYAAKDAKDIISMYNNSQGKYANVYTKQILNTQATATNIRKAKAFLANSKVDDHVVLFIASHGLLDDNLDYYLATTDIDFHNPQSKGLLYEDLEAVIDGIPARQKMLLIDACHSGEVDEDETNIAGGGMPVASAPSTNTSGVKARGFKRIGGPSIGMASSFELMKELFADLRRGSGAVVISSAGGKEFALESSQWSNGVFTYALLEGLQSGNADLDKNGEISVSEMKDYISKQVQLLTGGKQNPTSRRENLESDFKVW